MSPGAEALGVRAEARRLREGLGVWIWLPVLGLVALYLFMAALPDGAGCGEAPMEGEDLTKALNLGAALIGSLALLIAAVLRISSLMRGPGISRLQIALVAGAIVALGVLVDSAIADRVELYWEAWLGAVPATGALLVALLFTWLLGKKPDDVGLLLPLYLLGAAAFVYPGFALMVNAVQAGAFC